MDDLLHGFRETYAEARTAFVAVTSLAGGELRTYVNPKLGPSGEALATDTAWFGPRDAEKVLVVMSGTHGVEGLSGSACQLNWLNSDRPHNLPAGVAVLMIHLINPYGTAWAQRGTEDQIDLNRNFLDHQAPHRETPYYDLLHDAFLCPDRVGPARWSADAAIAAFRAEHGEQAYAQTVFGGQYSHPTGMNYGGRSAGWSNRTFTAIARQDLAQARQVVFLDYHTGLGAYGYASLIAFCNPGEPLHRRASAWYGPTVMPVGGPDVLPVLGHSGHGLGVALPHAELTALTVEFGTLDVDTECQVVVDDLWLQNHGDRTSPEGRAIKQALLDYFYPSSSDWRELIALRSRQVIDASLSGLAES